MKNGSERRKTRSEPTPNRLKSERNENENFDFLKIMTFFGHFSPAFTEARITTGDRHQPHETLEMS